VAHRRAIVTFEQQARDSHLAHMVGGVLVPHLQPLGYIKHRQLRLAVEQIEDLQAAVAGDALDNPLEPAVVGGGQHGDVKKLEIYP